MSREMGRRRSARFSDLAPNLEANPKGGRVYYRYKFPDGRRESLGSDKAMANACAHELNARFYGTDQVIARALREKPSINNPRLVDVIKEFRKHFLPGRRYAERTRAEIEIKLRVYEQEWPDQLVQSFSTLDMSTFLNERPLHAYMAHRKLLVDLFQFACHQGYRKDNPAQMTLTKSRREAPKERQRHTWEGYKAIYEQAPAWGKRAIHVLLYSLQRREDVVLLHRDQVDQDRGTITVLQRKTRNYNNPVYIEIEMGDELREVVDACLRSDVPCPYLVHRRPEKLSEAARKRKRHPFCVEPDFLSKQFAKWRAEAGAYKDLDPDQQPGIHELRALGARLYEKAGYTNEYIMALAGWADERMLEHYTKDHEQAKPRLVKAGLSLKEK